MISTNVLDSFEFCKRDICEFERQITNDEIQFELVGIGRITRQGLKNFYQNCCNLKEVSGLNSRVKLLNDIEEAVLTNFQILVSTLQNSAIDDKSIDFLQSRPIDNKEVIKNFVVRLIKAISILGANRVIELLSDWLDGNDLKFKQYFFIHGISVKKVLKVSESIEITPFTLYQQYIKDLFGLREFPRGALCSIERTEGNPIFKLILNVFNLGDSKASRLNVNDVSVLCDMLSLETGYRMNAITTWSEPGDIQAFCDTQLSEKHILNDAGVFFEIENSDISEILTNKDVQLALKLQQSVKDFKHNQDNLKTAISRWRESMRWSVGIWDQAVNLRISLEALYLNDIKNSGEFGYRLSSRSAWHLGLKSGEREKLFDDTRKFYSLASKAVHANNLKMTLHDVDLIDRAREICRSGIIKTIKDNKVYDWSKLVLGSRLKNYEYSDD